MRVPFTRGLRAACLLLAIGSLSGCQREASPPESAPAPAPASTVDYDWSYESESVFSGFLVVSHEGEELGRYAVDCSLEVEPEIDEEDAEAASVRQLSIQAHPNPLIVADCVVGAHSRRLMVFDPLSDPNEPILSRTGAYMARALERDGRLLIEHDESCEDCEVGFRTVSETWP